MKIRPLKGQVLLRMEQPPDKSEGGILIPETSREKAVIGAVVRTGIWRINKKGALIPFPAKAGDKVLINGRSGRWVKGEGLGFKIVDMEKILALIQD